MSKSGFETEAFFGYNLNPIGISEFARLKFIIPAVKLSGNVSSIWSIQAY